MLKLLRGSVLLLLSLALPAIAQPGPVDPETPPIVDDVPYDMAVIRQDQSLPRATFTLGHADNGTVTATVDGAAATLTVQKGSQAFSFSFSQVAQFSYPGDTQAQNSFITQMNDLAFDRQHLVSFESYSHRSGVEMGDGLIEPACAFVPCREINDPFTDHLINRVYIDYFPPPMPWWVGQYSPEIIEYDKQRWRNHVQQACNRAHGGGNVGGMIGRLAGTGAACFTSWSAITATACVVGAGETLAHGNRMSNDDYTCHRGTADSQYPGPTRWEN